MNGTRTARRKRKKTTRKANWTGFRLFGTRTDKRKVKSNTKLFLRKSEAIHSGGRISLVGKSGMRTGNKRKYLIGWRGNF